MATTEHKIDDSQALVKILNESMPDLKRLAPKYVNLNRLMALALEARLRNPILAKSSIDSVIAFCKRCAEWGTDRVGAGGVWPVPFWNSKTSSYDMQAIPDWRLLVEKARRAKVILHATADVVRDGDVFRVSRGMTPDLVHEPKLERTDAVVAAYCIYTLPDGTKDFVVMSRSELDAIRNRSKAWQGYLKDKSRLCPWNTDPEEMDKKTVIKRAMKLFEGASIELTILLEADHLAMGFDRFSEQPEPIAMPNVLTTPMEAAEPISAPGEQTSTAETPAVPPQPPQASLLLSAMRIPTGWIVGRDSKGKSIPHPHAGRPITDVPTDALATIMEGLRADPTVPGKPKEARHQALLDAIETEFDCRMRLEAP